MNLTSTQQQTMTPFVVNGENQDKYSSYCWESTQFTKKQDRELEREFNSSKTLDHMRCLGIANRLGLKKRQVYVWFKKRRLRNKNIKSDKANQNSNSNQVDQQKDCKTTSIMPFSVNDYLHEKYMNAFWQSLYRYDNTSQQCSPRSEHEHEYYPNSQPVHQFPCKQYQQFEPLNSANNQQQHQQHQQQLRSKVEKLSVEPKRKEVMPVATSEKRNQFLNLKKRKRGQIKVKDDNKSEDVPIYELSNVIKDNNLCQDKSTTTTGDGIIVYDDNFDIDAVRELRRLLQKLVCFRKFFCNNDK